MIKSIVILLACLLPMGASAGELGYDMDGDGIWDDISGYVEKIHPENDAAKQSTMQMVVAFQNIIKDAHSPSQTKLNSIEVSRALECSFYCNQYKAKAIYGALKLAMLNLPERAIRFRMAEEVLAGESIQISTDPDTWRQGCNFTPPMMSVKQPRPEGGYDGK